MKPLLPAGGDASKREAAAQALAGLSPEDRDLLAAVQESSYRLTTLEQFREFPANTEYFVLEPNIHKVEDVGWRYLAQHLDVLLPPELLDAIDPVPFGNHAMREEQGCFTSRGYLTLSGDEWEHERPRERQTEKKPSIKERLEQSRKKCASQSKVQPHREKSAPERGSIVMATIIKRKKNYSIVYNYVDEDGNSKQKWETRSSYQDALKRKTEIESQKVMGNFIPPSNQTIAEFLEDFVSLYGEKRWGLSVYDSQNSLIANYINPIIGDLKVQDINARVVDKYIQTLQNTPAVSTRTHHAKTTLVTNATIQKIIKLLRCAFKQAVRWELIGKNPFDNVVLPKTEYKKRDIWTADMIRIALDNCTDGKLYVAMNLAFACSLRMGEILGLTWDNVHISDQNIANDNAYVYIDKELTRASKRAIEMLGQRDVYYIFAPLLPNTSTRVILKKPKTESSIRKVWLPKTVAYILREWQSSQEELKNFLGSEYQDFNLVVALDNGRPCEDRIMLKEFEKLRETAGLPKVVFHSLRHSSTTYKLKLNNGDLKATQGDTGHAQIDMITNVYAHILDEDRKIGAQKFESAFYAKPDLRTVHPPQEEKASASDLEALLDQLRKSPELASTLASLLGAVTAGKQV